MGDGKVITALIQFGSFGVLAYLIYWAISTAHPQILTMMGKMLTTFQEEQERARREFEISLRLIQDRTDVRADKVTNAIEELRDDLRARDERDERDKKDVT